jgi:DNA-binding GntR family transcriptional regulator
MQETRVNFEPAVSLTEQIADHIGNQIIDGRLQPQTRIQELKVAGDLGVSRGSVREALLILQRRHLIEIIPRRGAVVSELDDREIADFCELFTDLQVSFFRKLARVPALNEKEFLQAVELIAGSLATQDRSQLLAGRAAFLAAGFAQLDNFYLCSVLEGLIPAGQRLAHRVAMNPAYDARDTLRYHQALLEAMRIQDAQRVEELVRAYHRREQKLALGCVQRATPQQSRKSEKPAVFSVSTGFK